MKAVLAGTAFFVVMIFISAALELDATPCKERHPVGFTCPEDTGNTEWSERPS